MGEEYERRRGVEEMDGPLGEDGPGEGGEVRDRGLFGGRHGHRSDYGEADAYVSEIGGGYGRRPPPVGGVMYEGEGGGYGGGYGSRLPPGAMMYEGQGGGYGGGYGGRPPMQPEVVYVEGASGGGYGGGGYAEEGYGRRPAVVYDEPVGEVSDLGTGLLDSNIRTQPDYGSGCGRSDLTGVPAGVYENPGHYRGHGHHGRTEEEFEEERRHKRYAESTAAAALGYGLYERHQNNEAEERLEELGYDSDGKRKHEHHLFRSDS